MNGYNCKNFTLLWPFMFHYYTNPYHGINVGKFHGNDIFSPKGKYIGEIYNNRLVVSKYKKSLTCDSFSALPNKKPHPKYRDQNGYALYPHFEEFPKLELLDNKE
ncbi:MAG: hypothetical protein N2645_11240 [Clostridia bacterium]|nr:hypothetical protein [Clostridia bacterium]